MFRGCRCIKYISLVSNYTHLCFPGYPCGGELSQLQWTEPCESCQLCPQCSASNSQTVNHSHDSLSLTTAGSMFHCLWIVSELVLSCKKILMHHHLWMQQCWLHEENCRSFMIIDFHVLYVQIKESEYEPQSSLWLIYQWKGEPMAEYSAYSSLKMEVSSSTPTTTSWALWVTAK